MKLPSLNAQILIGCLIGLAGGGWLSAQGSAPIVGEVLYGARMAGNLFLDLLRMVLVPLVFASIVVGVANLRAHHQMHRVWTTTLAFFVLTMGIAVIIGLSESACSSSTVMCPSSIMRWKTMLRDLIDSVTCRSGE